MSNLKTQLKELGLVGLEALSRIETLEAENIRLKKCLDMTGNHALQYANANSVLHDRLFRIKTTLTEVMEICYETA
jgi:cell shape-determining protein MreC